MKRILFLLGLLPVAFASTVIGTTNITFADAIVAEVVSKIYNYPVIILPRNNLTADVIQTLNELNATEVVIIGGPYVVTPKVEVELKNLGLNVTRIWGVTRYETSALVAKYFWDSSTYAVLVTRELTDEGLRLKEIPLVREAVGRAIDLKAPLLITPIGRLEENVAEALVDLGVRHVYIYTRAPLLHTNLTRQLKELNITYEVISQPRYKPKFCRNITLIEVPENATWYKLREAFLALCTKIKFVNKANITKIREILRRRLKKEFRRMLRNQTKIEEILMKRMEKMMEDIEKNLEIIQKINPEKAQEIRNRLNETIRLMSEGEIRKAMIRLMEMHRELLMLKWRERLYWKEVRAKIENIIKKIKERRVKILKRLYNLTEEDIKKLLTRHRLPDLRKIREKYWKVIRNRNRTIYCPQIYEPVICCDEYGCRRYSNKCFAYAAGEDLSKCKPIYVARPTKIQGIEVPEGRKK